MSSRPADGMPPHSKKVAGKCRWRRPLLVCAIFCISVGALPDFLGLRISNSSSQHVDEGSIASRRHACLQTADRLIAGLIAKINDDVQKNALAPLNISGSADNDTVAAVNVTMPGLDLRSFRGKRIALLGDSTLYWPIKYLVSMLIHHDRVGGDGIDYETLSLNQANRFVFNNKQYMLGGTKDVPPFRTDDGTWIQWWGMRGPSMGKTERLMDDMFARSEEMRPDVVVANMAFHWFQLCGYAFLCPTEEDSPLMLRWLTYRQSWLQRAYDHATQVGARLLLFKTANFICGDRRTDGRKGNWSTGDALYRSFDNATLERCADRLHPLARELFMGRNETLRYCKYGQFTDVGSRYVNAQMADFVREIRQREEADERGGLVVGLFDDYAVESCDTTDDAIHHKAAIPMRLRLLSNTIDSYLKCA